MSEQPHFEEVTQGKAAGHLTVGSVLVGRVKKPMGSVEFSAPSPTPEPLLPLTTSLQILFDQRS